MSKSEIASSKGLQSVKPTIGAFERNLTWWVLGCIVVGITLDQLLPSFFQMVGSLKIAEVNLPVAVLIWLMIFQCYLKSTLAP